MNITYDISFSLAALIITIIVLATVIIHYSTTSIVNKRYKLFLIASIVLIALDILTVITNDNPTLIPHHLNKILNGIYFINGALVGFLFLSYSVSVAYPNETKARKRIFYLINNSLLVIFIISMIVNHFVDIYFYYDDNLIYSKGPLYLLVNLLTIAYVIESIIIFIIRRKNFNKKQILASTTFYIFFFITFLLQLFVFPKVLLSDFGISLGCLIILFSIETPDYVNLVNTLKELEELKASLEEQVQERTNELANEKQSYKDLTSETLTSLAHVIDAKDHYTNGHSFRVAAYACALASRLGFVNQDLEQLYFAGLVHDVGKIGISETIIRKPAKLSEQEYEIIKSHTTLGGDILKGIKKFKIFEDVARFHHERYDGLGYPKKLKGEEIPYVARIVAVCDSFDAMTSDRSYRKALSDDQALKELFAGKGTQFDPYIVDEFIKLYYSFEDSIRNHIDELVENVTGGK